MAVPLLRTFLRSTQFLNGPLRNVSRRLGTLNLLGGAPVVLPSHSDLVHSRSLMNTTLAMATAARSAPAKKATTAGGVKKAAPKTATKKKTVASKKKLAASKQVAAKKKLAKTKAKKPKVPKSTFACSFACSTLTVCLSISLQEGLGSAFQETLVLLFEIRDGETKVQRSAHESR
jgi:hypothetical protein